MAAYGDGGGLVVVPADNVATLAKACQDRESKLIEMHRQAGWKSGTDMP